MPIETISLESATLQGRSASALTIADVVFIIQKGHIPVVIVKGAGGGRIYNVYMSNSKHEKFGMCRAGHHVEVDMRDAFIMSDNWITDTFIEAMTKSVSERAITKLMSTNNAT